LLYKCFNIGLQEERELINVSITLKPKEIKQENAVFKSPLLQGEMACNSFA
jgi:hypothetical protein